MRLRLVLAGAAVAALLLTVLAVLRVVQDPAVAACRAAIAAAEEANSVHQDLLVPKDREIRKRVRDVRAAEVATLRADVAYAELDAARGRLVLACHYREAEPDRT